MDFSFNHSTYYATSARYVMQGFATYHEHGSLFVLSAFVVSSFTSSVSILITWPIGAIGGVACAIPLIIWHFGAETECQTFTSKYWEKVSCNCLSLDKQVEECF